MKKLLLFAGLLIGGLSQLNAQCSIVNSCDPSATGYCSTPTASANLANGTESMPYNFTIQISVASSISGIPISNVTLVSVTGLPAGLTYSTNPANGVISGGTDACLLITGTPAASSAGDYTVTANVTLNGAIPATISWFLTVDPVATGIKSYFQTSNMFISPNPAASELTVSADVHFKKLMIIDALGKVVISKEADNANQVKIDVSDLTKGVYFLQVNDGAKIITRKFIKD
jgi:hypothetical protein